ncbi:hypothetical protein OF83DRAFT_1084744 [Amylostereum chailletii]|nr:hypothetical protein OF83DRAFT_1084744 [Amylostereum chailletii]
MKPPLCSLTRRVHARPTCLSVARATEAGRVAKGCTGMYVEGEGGVHGTGAGRGRAAQAGRTGVRARMSSANAHVDGVGAGMFRVWSGQGWRALRKRDLRRGQGIGVEDGGLAHRGRSVPRGGNRMHRARSLHTHLPPAAHCAHSPARPHRARSLARPPAPHLPAPHPLAHAPTGTHQRSRTLHPLARTTPARVCALGGTLAHLDAPVHHPRREHGRGMPRGACGTVAWAAARRRSDTWRGVAAGDERRGWASMGVGTGEGPPEREREKREGELTGSGATRWRRKGTVEHVVGVEGGGVVVEGVVGRGGGGGVVAWRQGDGGRERKKELARLPNWECILAVPVSRHLPGLELVKRDSVHSSPSSSDKG